MLSSAANSSRIFEVESSHSFGSEGGDAVVQLTYSGACIGGGANITIAEEDNECVGVWVDPKHLTGPACVTVASNGEPGSPRKRVIMWRRAVRRVDVPAAPEGCWRLDWSDRAGFACW